MISNYEGIFNENQQRYGTDIGRIGPMLLADRYDDRTHFIFELLQNAEDALSRREGCDGSRKVSFMLTSTQLILSHHGKPFDDADVRGVCGIAQSTKDESSIGRFGIGFKSVYTFTDRPEIHSGDQDFVIENFVQPRCADYTAREEDETLIILPFKKEDLDASSEIVKGFRHLGPGALLFLRNINEINWSVEGGISGFYLRSNPEMFTENVQQIKIIGQEDNQLEVDQNWLVFHRTVSSNVREDVGRVELAFELVAMEGGAKRWAVKPVVVSPLVVFFPTVVSTNLGFLIQGPYRTTPSRDNIPRNDSWNQHLVNETAKLLVEALRWMRDNEMIDVSALRCLPLDRNKFQEDSMFAPLFDAVLHTMANEPILPCFDSGYVTAAQAKLARTQELRELLNPGQVSVLFGVEGSAWLSGDITQDRTPDIRQYLMRELDVDEITPTKLVSHLTKQFLEAQSDEWILRLYEFLNGQDAVLRKYLDMIPLIRIEDGSHVVARENGKIQVFLPGRIVTSFPTIRRATCVTVDARSFLISLGITEPDPVDDVIWNILPTYQCEQPAIDLATYSAHIERIRTAFSTDSSAQREKLRVALRETAFVMALDAGTSTIHIAKPGDIYIATDRLKQLFVGVPHVLIVDDNYDCLRGEDMRDLLVACGASRYLSPQSIPSILDLSERTRIRKEAGLERASWESQPEDRTIRGLTELLSFLPNLEHDELKVRAELLWDSLIDLEGRSAGSFYGSYRWSYSHETKTAQFDAAFIRALNNVAWVPNANGELVPPGLVVFDSLGWKPNLFLLTKIIFKPQIIDQLAREAGIDPAALDLLRKYGITSVSELASRLGITNSSPEIEPDDDDTSGGSSDGDVYGDATDLYGDDMPNIPSGTHDPDGGDVVGVPRWGGKGGSNTGTGGSGYGGASGTTVRSGATWQPNRSPGGSGGRPFISYVGTHPDDRELDSDGLDHAVRMQIEGMAIELITSLEPKLRRTPEGNPGFDLYEVNDGGQTVRWVEVKSMTGSLDDRPVGISHAQFDCARLRGTAYWLYVVEYASDPVKARVLRIQDPYAHARTFTFDRGWREIARTELPS